MSSDTEVIYANGRASVELAGRHSQLLKLPVTAIGAQPSSWKNIEWAPKDGGVHDLEVRARVASATGSIGAGVKILWYAELGVADAEFREPISIPAPGSGTPIVPMWLPDRGMVLRVNARRVKLGFRCELTAGAATMVELQASIQPTSTGPNTPMFPKVQTAVAAERVAIPMAATRWRFRDPVTGAPFAAGTITLLGTFAGLSGPVLLANLADFCPISPVAATYTCTVTHLVEFE